MCLGVPGRLVETFEEDGILMGKVDFSGAVRKVCLHHIPEAEVGQYVLVHVGFALTVIDEAEAKRVFEFLEEAGLVELPDSDSR